MSTVEIFSAAGEGRHAMARHMHSGVMHRTVVM